MQPTSLVLTTEPAVPVSSLREQEAAAGKKKMNRYANHRAFQHDLDLLLSGYLGHADDVPQMAEELRRIATLIETSPEVRAEFGVAYETDDQTTP